MSIASSIRMETPFFHEIKKQALDFLREKFKHARLALTDVTPAELLTEEATSRNPWAPDARTMGFISKAAFEIDDFWRIVDVLHNRLAKFDKKHWRESYNSLVILEHLLTHGPESVADEFLCDRKVIRELGSFQHIDERGFNWGLSVRRKSEKILKFLEKRTVLKEERDRARKVTRGIQGFGSLNYRCFNGSKDAIECSSNSFGRCNSHYENYSQNTDALFDELYQRAHSDAETCDDRSRIIMAIKCSIDGVTSAKIYDKVTEEDEANIDKGLQSKGAAALESKLLLASKEEARPKRETRKEEHPFISHELRRMESIIL